MLKPAFLKIDENTSQHDSETWFAQKDIGIPHTITYKVTLHIVMDTESYIEQLPLPVMVRTMPMVGQIPIMVRTHALCI